MNQHYWKKHYVVEGDANVIEESIRRTSFVSDGRSFELIFFDNGTEASNILISPGTGGHSYIFAELGYYMYLRGYNVFIMPKHGGYSILELMARHSDALRHISMNFNDRIGIFAEGLGGYAVFYLALAHGKMRSAVYQNAPAILTEKKFREALLEGGGSSRRRRMILPLATVLLRLFPKIKIPISLYLNFEEMVDTQGESRRIEASCVRGFVDDPDFDKWYPLSAVMSLVSAPPPNPVSELKIPTMFLVPVRGFYPSYERDLFDRLPAIKKKLLEVDGSVFWMCSHPKQAAKVICEWFDETLH